MTVHHEWSTRRYEFANGQKLTTSATSTLSTNINSTEAMLSATAAMYITVGLTGTTPTAAAAAGNFFLSAGEKFHIQLTPGSVIAAVQSTVAGELYILPVK